MGGLFSSKQTQTNNSYSNTQGSYSNTSTPNIPEWWMERYNSIDDALDSTGRTANQGAVADFLRNNLNNNALGGAYGVASQATADALGAAGRFGGYIDSGVGALNRYADAAGASSGAIGDAMSYLANQQNNGSFTLGHWFPDAVAAAGSQAAGANAANVTAANALSAYAPAVAGGIGAAYMGSYATPLNNDFVNASLADYDTGAARGFNALRAGHADAFGNKRTGIAEGQFLADAARGRGTLASDLRLKAFNTAAGLGQSDADRALAADTTNAGNLLNNNQFNAANQLKTNQFNAANELQNNQFNAGNLLNNNQFNARLAQENSQFNANLLDSRQKFDAGQAEAGEQRRLGVANDLIAAAQARANANTAAANIAYQGVNAATAGVNAAAQRAALGAQGLDNAVNLNAANLANANALGNFDNMTLGQIYQLLNLGQAGIGKTDSGTSSSTTNSSGTTTTKSSPSPFDILSKFVSIPRISL